MAKRGRKRKLQVREPPRPPTPPIDRSTIELEEKEWMPVAAVEFFEQYEGIDEKLRKIDDSLELVGPFRVLRKETEVLGIERIMLDRTQTDLPEMQVFMTCHLGRYAFWRDSSSMNNPMVVLMCEKDFPDIRLLGNRVEHAILHHCDELSQIQDTPLYNKKNAFPNVLGMGKKEIEEEKKSILRILSRRRAECIGTAGLFRIARPDGMVAYRNVCKDTKKMIYMLRSMRRSMPRESEESVEREVERIKGDIMVCFDEGDFVDGLEWGHLFFQTNHTRIDETAEILLGMAYKLLGHNDFAQILRLTMELRRRKTIV